jgi:O-antigen ligase
MLAAAIAIHIGRDRPGRRGIFLLLASVIGTIAVFYLILGGTLDARFDMQALQDGGRAETHRSVLALIRAHPWFGSGLGTFRWVFPEYRSADISLWGIWDLAHSTPLELAADMGIPFALLICAGWLAMLWILMRGVFIRRRDATIPLAGFCVSMIGLLHSIIDFSLQVPGFAIVSLAITGAGLAQAFRSGKRHGPPTVNGADLDKSRLERQ